MREYETLHLVKGEDLNHHGTLFAARAAAWLVEAGFAAAACEYGRPEDIVFRGMDRMSFQKPLKKGAVVRFGSRVVHAGRSSLTVYVQARDMRETEAAVEGFLTFVVVEECTGKKIEHGVTLDAGAGPEEQAVRERAEELISRR